MTPAELLALAQRCEGASGPRGDVPSRGEIARAFGWHRVEPRHTRGQHGAWISPEEWLGAHPDGRPILDQMHGTEMCRHPPAFLESVDACLSAQKRLLKGWTRLVDATAPDLGIDVELHAPAPALDGVKGTAPTEPMAHCAAIIRALAAKASEP